MHAATCHLHGRREGSSGENPQRFPPDHVLAGHLGSVQPVRSHRGHHQHHSDDSSHLRLPDGHARSVFVAWLIAIFFSGIYEIRQQWEAIKKSEFEDTRMIK